MNSEAPHIYQIPGLGADYRVFKNLDYQGIPSTTIEWIAPLMKETLPEYSARLIAQITHPNPIIIGMSLGGIISVEISRLIPASKIIIVSSVRSSKEMPFYYKVLSVIKLHKLLTKKVMMKSFGLFYKLFGVEGPCEKILLKRIISDTDEHFLIWSINALVKWSGEESPQTIYHIHGDSDLIIPIGSLKPDAVIKKGGHFMILNRASEVSTLIQQYLNVK